MNIFFQDNKYIFGYILLIILSISIIYFNILPNKFLWDDEFLIQKNIFTRSLTNIPKIFTSCSGAGAKRLDNFYRPIQIFAYTIIYQLFGLNPFGYHILNLILHIFNAILIFFLLKKLFGSIAIAFFTSILWGIHPVHTEAVTYMSGTADLLAVFFMLSSMLFYIKSRDNKFIFIILSIMLFIFGLISKESVIIFPIILILIEFVLQKEQFNLKKYTNIFPYFVISGIYYASRLTIFNFINSTNLFNNPNIYTKNILYRIFTFLASLWQYLGFLIYPINLHMERNFPIFINLYNWEVPLAFIFIIFIFGIGIFMFYKHNNTKILFGFLWFLIAFIPMSGIFIPVNSLLLEHWLYFSSIGLFFLFSWLLKKLFDIKELKSIIIFILLLILIILGLITFRQNTFWRTPISWYEHILKFEPGSNRIFNNLAMAYAEQGQDKKAIKYYLKSIKMNKFYAQPHYNLARIYIKQRKYNQAIYHLKVSLDINPNFFYSYYLLAYIYQILDQQEKVKFYLNKAKDIKLY